MRTISATILLGPALLTSWLVVSCGPSTENPPEEPWIAESDAASSVAALQCRLLFECSCMLSPLYGATEAECVTNIRGIYAEWQASARAGGLTYDGACLARKLERLSARGCQTSVEIERDPREICAMDACSVYHGDLAAGEPCTRAGRYAHCVSGLSCFAELGGDEIERCTDACSPRFDTVVGLGEACRDASQHQIAYCERGTACNYANGVCERADVPVGGSCMYGYCVEGAYCEGMEAPEICYAKRPNGEPCERAEQCASGYCAPERRTCIAGLPEICYSNDI